MKIIIYCCAILILVSSCGNKLTNDEKNIPVISDTDISKLEDDTQKLQQLVSQGGVLKLDRAYKITTPIIITKSIEILGQDNLKTNAIEYSSIVFEGSNKAIFVINADVDVTITNVSVKNARFVEITSDVQNINLSNNYIENTDSGNELIAIYAKSPGPYLAKSVSISNSHFINTLPVFFDHISCNRLRFEYNKAVNSSRYVMRSIKKGARPNNFVHFNNNIIEGVQQDNKSKTARVLQINAKNDIEVSFNNMKNIRGETSANYVYWKSGNLKFTNNICSNLYSGTSALHNKGTASQYSTLVENNTFDQSNVPYYIRKNSSGNIYSYSNPSRGIVNTNTGQNIRIINNKFIGLKSNALRLFKTYPKNANLNSPVPSNVVFKNNIIDNLNYESVVAISQSAINVAVTDNEVSGLLENSYNPELVSSFVKISITSSKGSIDGVNIERNNLNNTGADLEVLETYMSGKIDCGSIKNIKIDKNSVKNLKKDIMKTRGKKPC